MFGRWAPRPNTAYAVFGPGAGPNTEYTVSAPGPSTAYMLCSGWAPRPNHSTKKQPHRGRLIQQQVAGTERQREGTPRQRGRAETHRKSGGTVPRGLCLTYCLTYQVMITNITKNSLSDLFGVFKMFQILYKKKCFQGLSKKKCIIIRRHCFIRKIRPRASKIRARRPKNIAKITPT